MDQQTLKSIFEKKYDRDKWYTIAREIFGADVLIEKPKEFDVSTKDIKATALHLGSFETTDDRLIGLYEVQIDEMVLLHRNRKGVRDLLNNVYKEVDGALIVFVQGNKWRFSYVSEIYTRDDKGKRQKKATDPKRYTYLLGEGERSKTAADRFAKVKTTATIFKTGVSLATLEEAFNVEKMSKDFFNDYRKHYGAFTAYITGEDENSKVVGKASTLLKSAFSENKKNARDFVKKTLGRIVFLYFLQKKGWLGVPKDKNWRDGDDKFVSNLFSDTKHKSNFYSNVLVPLFFDTLNKERKGDLFGIDKDEFTKGDYHKLKVPFLNGGLFEDDLPEGIIINFPKELFQNLFTFLDQYNFTVYEDSPDEHTVAVDPEMLGHIFENLLEDNKDKGAFYTPKEIVHYMCQESLIEYLYTKLNESGGVVKREAIEKLIKHQEAADIIEYDEQILNALRDVRVCDPAIGSGAFPMGILMEIYHAVETLAFASPDVTETVWKTIGWDPAKVKADIIQNTIYGVDIEKGAVDIARLRFWLSLVVEEDKPKPLPNLDYKIVRGDSLLGIPSNTVFNISEVERLEAFKKEYFSANGFKKKKDLKQMINEATIKILDTANQYSSFNIDFDFNLFFSEVYHGLNKGFDIIIGNPPYVGQKGHKELFQEIKKSDLGKKFHQRRMDLFYFFFHLGINNLKQNGVLAYITTNYFLTATYSDKLRQHMHDACSILSIINFNELKIFESAQGQHNAITFLKKGLNSGIVASTAITQRRGLADKKILDEILRKIDPQTCYYNQSQESLFEKNSLYLRIEPNEVVRGLEQKITVHNVLSSLQEESEPLGGLVDITTGIQSSSDKVTDAFLELYPNPSLTKGEGIFILTQQELEAKDFSSKDKKFIKKTYKNSDVRKWVFYPDNNLNVIYTKSDHSALTISDGIKKHLDRYKLILINRNIRAGKISLKDYDDFVAGKLKVSYIMNANAMKNGNYYCLSYARGGKDTFEVPKIVNPRRAKSNIFSYEEKGYYEQSDVVISTLKKKYAGIINLKYILAIINSTLIFNWLYFKGKRKGDMFELFQKPIAEIPIKIIEDQALLVNKVDQILFIKDQDPNANISVIEKEIDLLVYKIYNLSYQETCIIEGNTDWMSKEQYEAFTLK